KFKVQSYQTNSVEAVVDCFAGQPVSGGLRYRIDPGKAAQMAAFEEGFKNEDIRLTDAQLLTNIQSVQKCQNLTPVRSLDDFTEVDRKGQVKPKAKSYKPGAKLNLDI
ncbi:MAG: restriction endonuclease subunit R, partial [Candidatus Sedimenticola sp. 6PFRAG7]